jgi:rhodanese-related sulfurtransferase
MADQRQTDPMTSAIERYLDQVRARISVVDVESAHRMHAAGALLVDTRPLEQRRRHGVIDGAVLIDRTVLEWRLDPTSADRHPAAIGHTGPIIVFCQEGYSSILAVGTLNDLGVRDAHDLGGGFDAWVAAGLPITAC